MLPSAVRTELEGKNEEAEERLRGSAWHLRMFKGTGWGPAADRNPCGDLNR